MCEKKTNGASGLQKAIEEGVLNAYQKIEDAVVGAYRKVEGGAVKAFENVENFCVEKLFVKDGETVEEAKQRMKDELEK